MKKSKQGWAADFPIREEVEDYAGRTRAFVIDCHEGGLGFTGVGSPIKRHLSREKSIP